MSKANSDEYIEKTINTLKSNGKYDELRRQCLANIEDNSRYQDLLDKVDGFVKSFLHKQRWSSSTNKAQLRNRLKNALHDSKTIERAVFTLVDQLIYRTNLKSQLKKPIQENLKELLGIESKGKDEKPSPEKVHIEEETLDRTKFTNSFISVNFDKITSKDEDSSDKLLNKEEVSKDSEDSNSRQTRFFSSISQMDRISTDDDLSLQERLSVKPSETSPALSKVSSEPMDLDSDIEAETENIAQTVESKPEIEPKPPEEVVSQIRTDSVDSVFLQEESSKTSQEPSNSETPSVIETVIPEASIDDSSMTSLPDVKTEHLEDQPQTELEPKAETAIETQNVSSNHSKEEGKQSEPKKPKDSRNYPERIDSIFKMLKKLHQEQWKDVQDPFESDVSSVHTNDLSDFDDEIEFSDLEIPKMKLDEVEKVLASLPENVEEKKKPSESKKKRVQRVESTESVASESSSKQKRKRSRNVSISSESSMRSLVSQNTSPPESPVPSKRRRGSTSKKTKEEEKSEEKESESKNARRKPVRQQQRYDESDLHKPRLSYSSSRRNRLSTNDNVNSPASSSTQDS